MEFAKLIISDTHTDEGNSEHPIGIKSMTSLTFQNAISLGGHRFRSCWGLRSCFFTASTCYCCHGPHKHFAPQPLAIIKKNNGIVPTIDMA